MQDPMSNHFDSMNFSHPLPTSSGTVDLDGMTVMTDLAPTDPSLGLSLNLEPVSEMPEEGNMLDAPDSPTTAAFAPCTYTFLQGPRLFAKCA